MHDEIIRYHLAGEIDSRAVVEERKRLIEFLENSMRDSGCVPSIDLDPQFTLDYDSEKETYTFELSVYGVYVGGIEEAWAISGMTSGKTTLRHTHQIRSKAS